MVRTLSPEKHANILQTALRLFVSNGVPNTSTAEIAREAGIAAGTLFLYFQTKQDLIDELTLKIGRDQADNINSMLSPSLSVQERFSAIWNASIHWFLENLDAYEYIQQVRDTGMVSSVVAQESGKFFLFFYEAIQKGLQEGLIKPYPIDLIGGFLYQGILAVTNYVKTQPDPARREEAIRQGFEIFWNGIKQ